MTQILIFDIDGCLADDRHRRHHVIGKQRNYDAYHSMCRYDVPTKHIVEFKSLIEKSQYVIMTGRPAEHYNTTWLWFKFWASYMPENIFMRPTGDKTPAAELKRQWVREMVANGIKIDAAYDDDKRNLEMYRQEGIHAILWNTED